MFVFLIDPQGWTEIGGETFAPDFFLWNSEVGRRALGVETFWFQAVCQNHIVWDAVEVVEFSRKHTANVRDSLLDIRRIIQTLAAKRDQRRDAFAKVIQRAMQTRLGNDTEEVTAALAKAGIGRLLGSRRTRAVPRKRSEASLHHRASLLVWSLLGEPVEVGLTLEKRKPSSVTAERIAGASWTAGGARLERLRWAIWRLQSAKQSANCMAEPTYATIGHQCHVPCSRQRSIRKLPSRPSRVAS
jgi:hypothetical protein